MPEEIYESVRVGKSHFLVAPGHERAERELVVADGGSYLVVAERLADDARCLAS